MVSSVSWSVLTALALAGPAAATGGDDEAIGLVWHDEATGPSSFRQRVVAAMAQSSDPDAEPRAVIDRADQRARVSLALRLPRQRAETTVRLAAGLTDATARFREGDLSGAEAAVAAVLTAAAADPLLPGAAATSYSALVLQAQIAWTAGDAEVARASLARAVALSPEVELSTRRVPPAIASLYAEVRKEITEDREAWLPIEVSADPGTGPIVVEIDGLPGRRRVPVGRHFVVVRRPGRVPLGFVVEAGATVVVPEQAEKIAVGLPADRPAAEAICDHAAADRLVLVHALDTRIALEGYACGEGFAGLWFSEPYEATGQPYGPTDAELAGGVMLATAPTGRPRERSRLAAASPWPRPRPPDDAKPEIGPRIGPIDTVPPKAWYRRAWIWGLIGGVVLAGVTTGAVLGTREQPNEIRVDAESFLRP
ncbi:MAG: hypothetical protein AAF721_14585 [Myxococcota bacterium]